MKKICILLLSLFFVFGPIIAVRLRPATSPTICQLIPPRANDKDALSSAQAYMQLDGYLKLKRALQAIENKRLLFERQSGNYYNIF
jgi:hypothetical protein